MKLSTILPLAGGLAAGYVLGTAAGRGRYRQIRSAAQGLWRHPKVQETVFDLADQTKANAERLPGPAAGVVGAAATRLQENLTHPDDTAAAASNGVHGSGSQAPTPTSGPTLS